MTLLLALLMLASCLVAVACDLASTTVPPFSSDPGRVSTVSPSASPDPNPQRSSREPHGMTNATTIASRLGAVGNPRPYSKDQAPEFTLALLDGQLFSLSEFRGKPLVINFWASWCPPCRWEMPFLENIWGNHRDEGLVVIGVAMSDSHGAVEQFVGRVGTTYPIGLDETGMIAELYEVTALPTTFFVDRHGMITRRLSGGLSEGALNIFLQGIMDTQD